jgi:hypothetical protein
VTTTLKKRRTRSEAPPRWATPRTDRPTYGGRLAAISKALGTPFHPWQQQVADVALEYDPETGLLAYREVIVTVQRQTGKTTLIFSAELDRCIHSEEWGGRQRVAYSAQTGWDARKKLIEDQVEVLEDSPLLGFVSRVLKGTGNESILFKTGASIVLASSSKAAGHGKTLDLGIVDEAFKDIDDRREGAMVPAMKTRRNAQLWVASTAGTDESIYLQRKVRMGRAAVEEGSTEDIAYFEWSVPTDEEREEQGLEPLDIDDPEVWYSYIPAMDEVAEASMRHARKTMSESEFRRAFLNQWTQLATDRTIPAENWDAVCDPNVKPQNPVRLCLEVTEDRSSGSLGASGNNSVGELVKSFDGMSKVVDDCARVAKDQRASILIDATGPAISFADRLTAKGVKVQRVTGPEAAIASAATFDAIIDRTISVRSSHLFDIAAAAARKKPVGDRFVWSRTASAADVTPLIALTIAFGAPVTSNKPLIATT